MLITLRVCAPPPNGSYWTLSDRAPKCLLSICYTLTPSSFASAFRRAEHVINLPRFPLASNDTHKELICLFHWLSAATIPPRDTARTASSSSNIDINLAPSHHWCTPSSWIPNERLPRGGAPNPRPPCRLHQDLALSVAQAYEPDQRHAPPASGPRAPPPLHLDSTGLVPPHARNLPRQPGHRRLQA